MKTTILACVAAGCLALAGSAAIAAEGASKQRDPMLASAAMTTAAAVPVRYDSECRAQFGIGSNGYHNCLQRLPATRLIGGR